MSRSLIRPVLILAMLAAAVLATTSAALAGEGPSRWNDQGCHALDAGRVLCYVDKGLVSDNVSESGRWTYHYRGDTNWTIYAADGSVEHTERTQVNVVQQGDGAETQREQETFKYRYASEDYSCKVTSQLVVSNGEVKLDHQLDGCSIS
ncbi:MAG: hypothetical protein ACRDHF_15405 [Tepidiformaceae bacterium]